jgi:Family of unknown function (DUF6522)
MTAAMRLDRTEAGFAIDAADLGELLDLPIEAVRGLMRGGRITSRFERGEGMDEGRFRVTFYHGGRRVRLTLDGDGTVLQRSRVTAAAPPPARRRGGSP